jgi:predicted nucleic acid-binding protein
MILVDASVALKWFLDEDDSERARQLLGRQPLISSALALAETANGLWKAWRRSVLSADAVERALATLPALFSDLVPVDAVLVRAGAFARDLDHPVYDCIYLATAERFECPVITADVRLCQKLAGSPLRVLVRLLHEDV